MAKAGRKLTLQIFGNAKGATNALKATGDGATSMGKKIANSMPSLKQMAVATAAVGAAAAVLGKKFINMGSNLEESLSKVDVVFGDSAKAVKDFAASSAKSLGISEQAALEAAGTYGNLLRAFGLTQPMATEMSTSLVGLAADLASFNNTSVDDAILALRSGLSGETEPLKKFGIALTDVRLKEQAAAMGLGEFTGQLPIAIKSQAAYALIMKDSTLAQGDFARTSDGVANQQRIISAQFRDVGAQIGTALIPAFNVLLSVVSTKVLPVLGGLSDALRTGGLGGGMQFVADKIKIGAPIVVAALVDFVKKAADWIVTTGFPMFTAAIRKMATALIDWIQPRIVPMIEKIKTFFKAMLDWIVNTGLPFLVEKVQRLGDVLVGWIGTAARELPAKLVTFLGEIGKWLLSEGIPKLLVMGTELLGALIRWTASLGKNLIIGIGGAIVALVAALPDLFKGFVTGLGNIAISAARFFGEKLGALKDAVIGKVIGALNSLIEKFNSIPFIPNIDLITVSLDQESAAMKTSTARSIIYADGIKQIVQPTVAATAAVVDLTAGTTDLGNTLGGGGGKKSVKTQLEIAAEKLKVYTAALKSTNSAQKAATDAAKAVVKAQDSMTSAIAATAKAQASFDQIVRGYGRGSKQAMTAEKAREDGQRSLERSGYAIEQATFAVSDAEKALQELRADPESTPQAIRLAEIALAEAKLSTADAIDAQTEATDALQAAEHHLDETINGAKEGSIAYTDALKDLIDAKAAQADASDRVSDAIDRETEATLKLKDARDALAEIAKKTPKGIIATATAATSVAAVATTMPSFSQAEIDQAIAGIEASLAGIDFGNIFGGWGGLVMGDGGIVTSPTAAIIGERGAEAVIPLSKLDSLSGSTNVYVTVNAGMGTDGAAVGDEIVNILARWNRRNGSLPLTVV